MKFFFRCSKAIMVFAMVFVLSCKKDKPDDGVDTVKVDTVNVDTTGVQKNCLITKASYVNSTDPTENFVRDYIYGSDGKVVEFKDNDGESWKLTYNNNGQLVRVDYLSIDSPKDYEEFIYNGNGQVSKVTRFSEETLYKARKNLFGPESKGLSFLIEYLAKDKTVIKAKPSGFVLTGWSSFVYTSEGWIDKEMGYNADGEFEAETRYTYDSIGNPLKASSYADFMQEGELQLVVESSMKYGNDKSPVFDWNYLPLAFKGPIASINHPTEIKQSFFGQTIDETYINETNSDQYVVKSTSNDGAYTKFNYNCK